MNPKRADPQQEGERGIQRDRQTHTQQRERISERLVERYLYITSVAERGRRETERERQ